MPTTSRQTNSALLTLGICLALAAAVLAAYFPAIHFDFINYDDSDYVTGNKHVLAGLNWEGFFWAFKTGHSSNWHPLTWLSHMLDAQFFGPRAGGHHLTNVLFHIANTLLLFLLLKKMTGAVWRSGFVAALFALHPLHVESVAWVSERKDVLSTFFGLLSLWAYARYARAVFRSQSSGFSRKWSAWYFLALALFALALMSKPMLVTLPFVLALLDYWPLGRSGFSPTSFKPSALGGLLLEKVPFLVLSVASCIVTFLVQRRGNSVLPMDALPLAARFGNAAVAYLRYLGKLFWPARLAIPYPYCEIPLSLAALAMLLLLAISVAALRFARTRPYLTVGWFWFLGTLVPVIGLVQVGPQAMADRYTYIPLVGLFVAVAWQAHESLARLKHGKVLLGVLAGVALVPCLVAARTQAGYWKNSETLFRHSLSATAGNYVAHDCLGAALAEQHKLDAARVEFALALQIKPGFTHAASDLGKLLYDEGKFADAAALFEKVVALRPKDAEDFQNLASALASQGKLEAAIQHYEQALRLKPDYDEARANLSAVLAQSRQWEAAARHYESGATLLKAEHTKAAIDEFQEALRLRPDWAEVLNNLAWLLATHPSAGVRDGPRAVSLAERACELTGRTNLWFMSSLAAAYAEAGNETQAVTAQRAVCALAASQGHPEELERFRDRLELYRSGHPYHRP